MKGITGHRVHDAYASMGARPAGVRAKPEQSGLGSERTSPEAASVTISDGARKLFAGRGTSDAVRIDELKQKVSAGPEAFNADLIAERMLVELRG